MLPVRFVPGTAYKLDGAEFSFHNVTESESVPEITEVVPSGVGSASGTWSRREIPAGSAFPVVAVATLRGGRILV